MKKIFFFLIAFLPVVAIIVLNLTISMVSETISISVESISFLKTQSSQILGKACNSHQTYFHQMQATKDLTWESSDESVVMVTPFGQATFLGFGSAYVTATTLDGNKNCHKLNYHIKEHFNFDLSFWL